MTDTNFPIPEPVARVADIMSTFRPTWYLCGGWAVDVWLGRITRDHADVDIAIFHDDQRAIFDHLAGWPAGRARSERRRRHGRAVGRA